MKSAPPPAKEPIPPVRLNRTLVWVDTQFAKLDGWIGRWLPHELNPLALSGRTANFAILIAVVTGILMLFWYVPSLQSAYPSLQSIQGRTLGGWMRAMHRYSSDLVMLLVLIHAGRIFFARKFSGARWLPWVSGIFLLLLVWFIGWTGYWLVWDQPAQQVAITSMRFLDAIPVFGEPMSRLFAADRLIPSLLFFVVFFLHMLLPLLIAVGLIFHLARITRIRLLPGRTLCILILVALTIVSILIPAPLDNPADVSTKVEYLTVDAWYLTPLALGLRLTDAGLWLVSGFTILLALAVPWIFGRQRSPRPSDESGEPLTSFQSHVTASRCNACTQCFQDCPFGAISMIPREDDRPYNARAWVDPSRCVGCAICVGSCDSEAMNLPWFDLRTEESRIIEKLRMDLQKNPETPAALVAGDIFGGLSFFRRSQWEQRLPGYSVHFVPSASWIRPRLVERLLRTGAAGVLVVRDNRTESAARDANQWLQLRLEGKREPYYRPRHAGEYPEAWRIVDYDPSSPANLSRIAASFRQKTNTPSKGKPRPRRFTALIAASLLVALVTVITVAPSHLQVSNPANPEPEFILSFKAFGQLENQRQREPEEDDSRPIHMRGRPTGKLARHPVTVRIIIDGQLHERDFAAKGISRDGPAIDQWRLFPPPGEHQITVEIIPGPDSASLTWSGLLLAEFRRRSVLTFDPHQGFTPESGLRDGQ